MLPVGVKYNHRLLDTPHSASLRSRWRASRRVATVHACASPSTHALIQQTHAVLLQTAGTLAVTTHGHVRRFGRNGVRAMRAAAHIGVARNAASSALAVHLQTTVLARAAQDHGNSRRESPRARARTRRHRRVTVVPCTHQNFVLYFEEHVRNNPRTKLTNIHLVHYCAA